MARMRILIEGQLGYISLRSFALVMEKTLWVFHDLDKRLSERKKGTLQWVITGLGEGSTYVDVGTRISARGADDISGNVHSTFFHGLQTISEGEQSPDNFSVETITRIRDIVRQLGKDGVEGIVFESPDNHQKVTLGPDIEANVNKVIGTHHKALGSVEGRVELVSVHPRSRRFNLYHRVTHRAIQCNLPSDLEADVFDAAEKRRRVIVTGTISYNFLGEPLRVAVRRLRFLKQEEELPTNEEILGFAPGITGGLSTEEYMRSTRDD